MGFLRSLRRKSIRKPLFSTLVFMVMAVYMAVQFAAPVSALDPCQKKLFSSNINYFNCAIDCVSPGGGGGTIKPGDEVPDDQLPGNDVQSKIWNYLIAQGWTPVQAAGIMGNIAVEGVWDPTNIEDPAGSTKDPAKVRNLTAQNQGYGLFGFTPGASLLTNSPIKWNVSGVKVTDSNFYYISTQLDVVYGFMKNYNNEAVQYQNQAGKSASPQEASIAFMNIFENPATNVSHDERREKAAKKAMDRFGNGGGTTLATGSDETAPSGEGGTCCGSTPVGTDSDSTLSDVYVLGDSITEASESAYKKAFNDQSIKFDIDASVSRGIDAPGTTGNKLSGSRAITHDKDKIKKADAVVVALGTNGGATGAQINKTVSAIEDINPDASIYWVDIISVGRSDNFNDTITGPTNRAIRKGAADNGYQVIHWFNKVDPDGNPGNPSKSEKDPNGYINKDDNLGVHPTAGGSKALAGLVLKSIGGSSSADTGPDDSGAGGCCGTPGGGSITLAGNDNEQQVFNFFTGNMGYSPDQAAGAVGSLMLESSMNPTISNGSGSGAYGIAQWLGSRFTGLKTFAGKDYDTLQGQVGFMQHELKTDYASVNSKMKNASSYQEAQKIWTQYYEGLLDYPDQWYFDKRNNFAHDALQQYGGGGGGGGGSGGGGSCETGGSASANVNTAVQAAKELSSYKIPYVWGGLHGANQLAITDSERLKDIGADCSGSVSWVLHQAGMLGASADDSTALESWGKAGKGRTMTVWANSEHAFIEFNVPGLGHYQLNTSGWDGSGPHFFKMDYNTDGFTPRHWPGT